MAWDEMNFTFWMNPSCTSPFTFASRINRKLIMRKQAAAAIIHCQKILRCVFATTQRAATNGTSANGTRRSVNCTMTSWK